MQEITAEDIAKLTARPATADQEAGNASEDEGSDSSSSAGEGQQQQHQQEQQQAEQQTEQQAEQQAGTVAQGSASVVEGSGDEAAGSSGSGPDEPGAGAGGEEGSAQEADDAAEVAALLREENVEALAEEEREKLTQVWVGEGLGLAVWPAEPRQALGPAAPLPLQSRLRPTPSRRPLGHRRAVLWSPPCPAAAVGPADWAAACRRHPALRGPCVRALPGRGTAWPGG